MFNPKITQGPWNIGLIQKEHDKFYCSSIGPLETSSQELCCHCRLFSDVLGDLDAVSAVPELLEVYKAAVGVLGAKSEDEDIKELIALADAVNTLEERHCG